MTEAPTTKIAYLEREADIAADYLEELLDITDLDGDIELDIEADRPLVAIEGGDLAVLVGEDGKVLQALQDLARLAVQRETGERSRLMLDVGCHRAARKATLAKFGAETAAKVIKSGKSIKLDPMSAFERKVVHDAVNAAGALSESEGEEPNRYIVVRPPAA